MLLTVYSICKRSVIHAESESFMLVNVYFYEYLMSCVNSTHSLQNFLKPEINAKSSIWYSEEIKTL